MLMRTESFHVKLTSDPRITISDFDEILLVASNTFQTRFCKVSALDNQWLVHNHHQCRGDICCCGFFHEKQQILKLFSGPTRQATSIKLLVPTKLAELNTIIILPLLNNCVQLAVLNTIIILPLLNNCVQLAVLNTIIMLPLLNNCVQLAVLNTIIILPLLNNCVQLAVLNTIIILPLLNNCVQLAELNTIIILPLLNNCVQLAELNTIIILPLLKICPDLYYACQNQDKQILMIIFMGI